MFTLISQRMYQGKIGNEHIWIGKSGDPDVEGILAGSLLGGEVIRMRAIRGNQLDESRYQLSNDGTGTLPYHSWIVSHRDEQWLDFLNEGQTLDTLEPYLQSFLFDSNAIRLIRPLASQERIYGLGERTGTMNKRGHAFPVWNVDPPHPHNFETMTMYTSIPFYMSLHIEDGSASGVLIDHTGRIDMDLGLTNETELAITAQGDSFVVYFFTGPKSGDVLRQYTELTGQMPLPPRWALGYHQSRWGYISEEQIRQIANRLRERNHPCDGIWLDIDYMQEYRNFTWNAELFPDPSQMLHDLHEQGIHLVTIIDPGIKVDEKYLVYLQGIENDYFC